MLAIDKLTFIAEQLISKGNFETINDSFSENYVAHSGSKVFTGHAFLKKYTQQIRTALPDIKLLKTEILTEANQLITWQRTLSGTHKGALMGIPASHKKVKWHEMVVTRFDGDKIAEEWLVSDLAFQLMIKLKK